MPRDQNVPARGPHCARQVAAEEIAQALKRTDAWTVDHEERT